MKIAVIDDERSARNELIYQILHTMPESEISEAGQRKQRACADERE